MSIAERIQEALKIRDLKQADLVKLTGIGKSSISTYISGEYEPKQRNIYKIAKALNVNEAWLMGHDVPMKLEIDEKRKQIQILNYFDILNDIGKHEATKRVEELTYIPQYTSDSTSGSNILKAAHNDYAEDPEERALIYEDLKKMETDW